jgi:hypothetical protein
MPYCLLFGARRELSFRARWVSASVGRLVVTVSFLMLVRDWIRWARPRVQIAKSAITRDHVRNAFLHSTVLAVPVHVSFEVYHCAPGSVTISSTGCISEACYDRNGSDTNCQFRRGFCHDNLSLASFECFSKHRNGKINPDPVMLSTWRNAQ